MGGKLLKLELENFKSYYGTHTIGPFSKFTSIIGPNGAGKSNLMDAISFVLGIHSHQLRSANFKELVYKGADCNYAIVSLYYERVDGELTIFSRKVLASGNTEYSMNGRVTPFAKFNAALESENILVKARNFLVFQGDIESISAKSPKDLSKLFEQISGSDVYKGDYERLKTALELAQESSNLASDQRKLIAAEYRSAKEQKSEHSKYDNLLLQRDALLEQDALYQLFKIEQNIKGNQEQIARLQNEKENLSALSNAETEKSTHIKTEIAKINLMILDVEGREASLKKEIEENTHLLEHLNLKVDSDTRERKILEANLSSLTNSILKSEELISRLTEEKIRLKTALSALGETAHFKMKDHELVNEFEDIKAQFENEMRCELRQLESMKKEVFPFHESIDRMVKSLAQMQNSHEMYISQKESLTNQLNRAQDSLHDALGRESCLRDELKSIERQGLLNLEKEKNLNSQLKNTLQSILQLNVSKKGLEKQKKTRELIADMMKLFPGVRGKLVDLCQPTNSKFEDALSVVLHKNANSIIVERESVARDCIKYLKDKKAAPMTFIPLDSISFKPVPDIVKTLLSHPSATIRNGVKLAIDVIHLERKDLFPCFAYAIGNSIICNTLDIAREVCYGMNIKTKAITLDGSVIHKNGYLSGGSIAASATPGDNSNQWQIAEYDRLSTLKESLLTELESIRTERDSMKDKNVLLLKLTEIERFVSSCRSEIEKIQNEKALVERDTESVVRSMDETSRNIQAIQAKLDESNLPDAIQELEAQIAKMRSRKFAAFCKRHKIQDISEFEKDTLEEAQKFIVHRNAINSLLIKITEQIACEEDLCNTQRGQKENLITGITELSHTIESGCVDVSRLAQHTSKLKTELERLESSISAHKSNIKKLNVEFNQLRRNLDTIKKSTESIEDSILTQMYLSDKFMQEKYDALRLFYLDNIDIPLLVLGTKKKKTTRVGLSTHLGAYFDDDSVAKVMMNSDAKTQLLEVFSSFDVDFSSLPATEELSDTTFKDAIVAINSQLDQIRPNLQISHKWEAVEKRMKEANLAYEQARMQYRATLDEYGLVKRKRIDAFKKAFSHCEAKIDQIYKELTMDRSIKIGGTAYLSLENTEEPYLEGIRFNAMPPLKRFRDMDQLSGGERSIAALALIFAIQSYRPAPFVILDEVDAALDNSNVIRLAQYIINESNGGNTQCILISLKSLLYEKSDSLVGIYKNELSNTDILSSQVLTLNLAEYPEERVV